MYMGKGALTGQRGKRKAGRFFFNYDSQDKEHLDRISDAVSWRGKQTFKFYDSVILV